MYIDIDRTKPITTQIYKDLKTKIMNGELKGGYRLPSTRTLSVELSVSRNVVMEVYDQLLAEGFLISKTGDGSYVAKGLTFKTSNIELEIKKEEIGFNRFNTDLIDFKSGLPDLSCFPINKWLKITKEIYQEATPLTFAYGQPEGELELRKAIAHYTSTFRGVKCHHDQILITGGTTQAIGIVARILILKKNNNIYLEDPVTIDIQKIIKATGGKLHPVPVDENGFMTNELEKGPSPAGIFVTPSHHYPIGVTMSIKRRIDLINYARENNTFIVEDDYDSEFRYDVKPTPSIQGLDPDRVIYMGTFSKTLCPALRIGYLILPPDLIMKGRKQKWFNDLHNPVMDQKVLARFINEGHFNRSVHKMKKKHKAKREYLIKKLIENFGKKVEILGDSIGIHLCARFKGINFTRDYLIFLESQGVKVYSVEEHSIIKGKYKDTIILGYGILSKDDIEKGVSILRKSITS